MLTQARARSNTIKEINRRSLSLNTLNDMLFVTTSAKCERSSTFCTVLKSMNKIYITEVPEQLFIDVRIQLKEKHS